MRQIRRAVQLNGTLLICVLLLISGLVSCEKEVQINLNSGEPRLVVDGQIETNGYPLVVLTKSIGYFSKIDLATIQNNFAHDAIVRVTDGLDTIQLREYALDTGFGGANKFYIYTIDTSDPGSFNFKGVTERTYWLMIEHEGKSYEGVTKIPNVKQVDSLWFRKPSGNPPVEASRLMFIKFTDPDTAGNYIRYFTSTNSGLFLPGFNSVYEDDIVNGTTVDSLNLAAGYDRSRDPDLDSLGFFFAGDTVTLRWCAIDRGVFDFFRTYEYATGTVGNPFASPVNVSTNIRGVL
ncbi:MAG: DUF4249 domain-containing protein [Chitinophagaceae bacterium]|nr:MAG: DUF4249 domain-containing protein [Chitinophagaceae bacterium]